MSSQVILLCLAVWKDDILTKEQYHKINVAVYRYVSIKQVPIHNPYVAFWLNKIMFMVQVVAKSFDEKENKNKDHLKVALSLHVWCWYFLMDDRQISGKCS